MDDPPRILIVDDDPEIRELLARFLTKHGLCVTVARNAAETAPFLEKPGFEKAGLEKKDAIDLMVLDLMMPGEDGLALIQRLRAQGCALPIILLTAMGEEADRIVGLEIGADDYLAKPFSPRELLARIKAILRRSNSGPVPPVAGGGRGRLHRFQGWTLDLASRDLTSPEGVRVALSAGEFDLLQVFLEHPRRVLSRDLLLDLARGRQAIAFDRSIDIQVSRLRRKLKDDPKEPQMLKTVRGGGYLFTPEVESA